jgi:hypothetical protein
MSGLLACRIDDLQRCSVGYRSWSRRFHFTLEQKRRYPKRQNAFESYAFRIECRCKPLNFVRLMIEVRTLADLPDCPGLPRTEGFEGKNR